MGETEIELLINTFRRLIAVGVSWDSIMGAILAHGGDVAYNAARVAIGTYQRTHETADEMMCRHIQESASFPTYAEYLAAHPTK